MTLHLVIDMRCLQAGDRAERGIPSHTRALMRGLRASPAFAKARVTGVIGRHLPPLPADLAAVADDLRPNGYLPNLPPDSLFLNLSPMAPDQQDLARLLDNPGIAKAAIVFDFIPLDDPASYLAAASARLAYHTALAWLRRYTLFLPISAPTDTRLRGLMPHARSVVIGAPLTLFAHAEPALPPRHILMVGGDDARKNPDLPIRAHAASAALQRARIPLIVTGRYAPARQAQLRAVAVQAGGDPTLLVLPGLLPAAALREACRAAWCVVTPSHAEGFSLPVVEAMAAGVPSLASDIPAHAQLLADPAWRFAPDDAAALCGLLERLVANPVARAAIVAAQAGIWPVFRAETVAATFWSTLAASATLAAPAVTAHRRPRLALLSPLPPTQSGVADFSAALAQALSARAEVTLFAPGHAGGALPLSGFPHLSRRFDRAISALGNSPQYGAIYDLLLRYGGACICHDARLLGFALSSFGPSRTAVLAAAELGRAVTPAEVIAWGADETTRPVTLLGEVAAAARPLIFHNRHSVAEIGARFGATALHLPFAIYRPWPDADITAAARLAAKGRLSLAAGPPVIASFGFAAAFKGIDPALQALALLRDAGQPCRLLWVGQAMGDLAAYATRARELGIADLVHFNTDYLTEAAYRDHLLAADFGLQLRIGQPGNVSGALQDCIAAGLPTVANHDLADNLDAPSYIHRVGDELNPIEIRDAFLTLRATHGTGYEQERQAYAERYSMARYAERLCEMLEV